MNLKPRLYDEGSTIDQTLKAIWEMMKIMILIAVYAAICAIPVYFLWNWVGVEILGLKKVLLIEAWGILCLAGLLFKKS